MIKLKKLHHITIICSDYEKSKAFYTDIQGFEIENEVYSRKKQSYKLDLSLHGVYLVELFSFPHPPGRLSRLEAGIMAHCF
jgi:glyoxylase I family protein